jgi:hypothetical protein
MVKNPDLVLVLPPDEATAFAGPDSEASYTIDAFGFRHLGAVVVRRASLSDGRVRLTFRYYSRAQIRA